MKKMIGLATIAAGPVGSAMLTGSVAEAEQQAGCYRMRALSHLDR